MVPLNSEESNAGNALRLLLSPLNINSEQFFPMYDGKNGEETSALLYESLLCKLLDVNSQGLPCFDLLYLGIGIDGHIASLFPHSPLIDMAINHQNYVSTAHAQGVVQERITLMPKIINAAKHVHVLAMGREKASVVEDVLNGPYAPSRLPAQLVLRAMVSDVSLFLAGMGELRQSQ